MFGLNKYNLAQSWCGHWVDKTGKQLIIKLNPPYGYSVSILDSIGQPFKIIMLDEKSKLTLDLIGTISKDLDGRSMLQIEAGAEGLGPTYNLYFLTNDLNNQIRLANSKDDLKNIFIRPNIEMGLYDDWEDDLGVPWAIPLEDYIKTDI